MRYEKNWESTLLWMDAETDDEKQVTAELDFELAVRAGDPLIAEDAWRRMHPDMRDKARKVGEEVAAGGPAGP